MTNLVTKSEPNFGDYLSMGFGVVSSAGQIAGQAAPLITHKVPWLAHCALSHQLLFRRLGILSMALSAGSSIYKLSNHQVSESELKKEYFNIATALIGFGGIALSGTPWGKGIMFVSAGVDVVNAILQINGIAQSGINFNNGFWLAQTATQLGLVLCLRKTPASRLPRIRGSESDFYHPYAEHFAAGEKTFVPPDLSGKHLNEGIRFVPKNGLMGDGHIVCTGPDSKISFVGVYNDNQISLFGGVIKARQEDTTIAMVDDGQALVVDSISPLTVRVGETGVEVNKLKIFADGKFNNGNKYRWSRIEPDVAVGQPFKVTVGDKSPIFLEKLSGSAKHSVQISPDGSCVLTGPHRLTPNWDREVFPDAIIDVAQARISPDKTIELTTDGDLPFTYPKKFLGLDLKWQRAVIAASGRMIFGRTPDTVGDGITMKIKIGPFQRKLKMNQVAIDREGGITASLMSSNLAVDRGGNVVVLPNPDSSSRIMYRLSGMYDRKAGVIIPEWVLSGNVLYRCLDGQLIYDSKIQSI